ncbi:MAG: hypothetical protein JSW26_14760 [Desulfobacterales bacterium]|nr:MAG: hypothetical protein JSW26_14760 [Desulfobacterales bacterium]
MTYEYYIGVIDEAAVLAECGPMRLVIQAWRRGQPQIGQAWQAAEEAIAYLERIARCRKVLSRPWHRIEKLPKDELALRMIDSAKTVGDDDLTPMAAVAGTIADAVADRLFERGMTKVVVDNGGDIAIRLAKGAKVKVGVRPSIRSAAVSHVFGLDSRMQSWGVTTSGFGGRSFTRGIASAVTALAASAAVADAASTAIANACFLESKKIRQMPAEQIDPNTDLASLAVTVGIGELSQAEIKAALKKALQRAEDLVACGVILGALICHENIFVMTSSLKTFIRMSGNRRHNGEGALARC